MQGRRQPAERGQGVVEYTGAIVVAVVMLGIIMAAIPDPSITLFTDLWTTVSEDILAHLDAHL